MNATDARAPAGPTRQVDVWALATRYALLLGFVTLCVFFSARTSLFLTSGNIKNILLSGAVLLIVAIPQALLVIMGYVDLSVGSVLGLCGVVTGVLIAEHEWSWILAAVTAIAVGALAGLGNGLLVTYLNLSAVIVTLGGLQIYRGLSQVITTQPPADFGDGMALLGRGRWMTVPVPVWISAFVVLAGFIVLYRLPSGRHMFAIGVNRDSAFMSGVPIRRVPIMVFIATGAGSGVGGLLLAARLDSAPPSTLGSGFELTVLTAVLLGGVAFSGGRGTMLGVVLGVLFLGVMANGMTLLNVPYYHQSIANGAALLIAAGLDELGSGTSLLRKVLGADRKKP